MKVDRVAERVANWIGKSQGTQKVLKSVNKNPAIFSAVVFWVSFHFKASGYRSTPLQE